jgi:hypothetical protein
MGKKNNKKYPYALTYGGGDDLYHVKLPDK